jgi:UPF0755 protein
VGSEQQAPPKRKEGRWRFPLFLLRVVLFAWAAVFLAALAAGFAAFVVFDHATYTGTSGPVRHVTVPDGLTKLAMGEVLVEAGLIDKPIFWRIALMRDGTNTPIQSGEYALPEGLSALQLLHRMYEGPARALHADRFRVTIPEGLSLAQVAERFSDPAAFLEAATDETLIAKAGITADSLEGFLMPETYFFDREPAPREVAQRMLDQFLRVYAREASGLPAIDPYTVVTVASLVEEEAKLDSERPLIAAVIYNRLDRNMPLQMDASLQYALDKYGQRMLDEDKESDSPYNTYRFPGLPPGPISNPGAASLRAALRPANVDYLYFVSNADGRTHTFSTTLDEHNRAVAKFRREIAEQRKALESGG